MDELIAKYADVLQNIYDKRIAGEHTFSGVLGAFLTDARVVAQREEN